MKNILVTGGLGFIGHNVVKQLEDNGNNVTIIDSETDYGFIPRDEMDYLIAERKSKVKAISYPVDIRGRTTIDVAFHTGNFDTVVHLASFPRQKVVSTNPSYASEVMVTGLINLLESSIRNGVRKFVYISSSMVYGDFFNDVLETAVCKPQGQYGIMKYMGEKLVEDYAKRTGLQTVIIRPSAVYGEFDVEDRVVSKFMLNAMRGKTLKINGAAEVLDFSYVEETARGIVLATELDVANGQIYNITRSDEQLYTLEDAAKIAIKIAGKGDILIQGREDGFPARGRLSIEKARRELGYNPQVTVEEGFRKYHKWFQESEFWQHKL